MIAKSELGTQSAIRWIVPACVFAALISLVMSSYPMMRPGFDVWSHLGVINHVDDPTSPFPSTTKFFWHHFWNVILRGLGIRDLFLQALIIHRSQFALTLVLITLAAYFSIQTFKKLIEAGEPETWTCSLGACVIWLIMHGTHSTAHDQGLGSSVTQSWMLWYSVNYQISLPFVILATSLTLYYFATDLSVRRRVVIASYIIFCLLISFLSHMAEIIYYVLSIFLLGAFFIRGPRGILTLTSILIVAGICVVIVLQFVHMTPDFLVTASRGNLGEMIKSITEQGDFLHREELLRLETGWTLLHLLSLLSLIGLLVASYDLRRKDREARQMSSSILFLISTSIFPLALFTTLGAGLFAQITYGLIAYRFAYFDLLFVGIPAFTFFLVKLVRTRLFANKFGAMASVSDLICLTLVLSVAVFSTSAVDKSIRSFGNSLIYSLDPPRMYFGVSNDDRQSLHALARSLRGSDSILCTDIFTAYYLFFLENFTQVAMPVALYQIPGYQPSDQPCSFPSTPSTN